MYEYELFYDGELFKGVVSEDSIEKMLRTYDKNCFTYEKLPAASKSQSETTCFCPNISCSHLITIKKDQQVYTCPCCGKKFQVK